MIRTLVVATMVLGVATGASAQTMNADAFYKRAIALQKKGPLAMLSMGEVNALITEGKAAAERSKAQRLAAQKAGKKPRYCPPDGPQSMDSSEYLKGLGAIPAADRARIDMTEATTRILATKYPCRG